MQLAVLVVLLLAAPAAAAQQPRAPSAPAEAWPLSVSVGGGITRPGKTLIEATLSPNPVGPHLSFGLADGNRLYGELGLNVLLTVAVGGAVDSPDHKVAVHLFVGMPLPIIGGGPAGWTTFFPDRSPFRPSICTRSRSFDLNGPARRPCTRTMAFC